MKTGELQKLTVKELHGICDSLGFKEYSGLIKQDLIKAILQTKAKNKETIVGEGVLEVLSDGYGFLRSPDYSYLPGPDDIYVSHSQIKKFHLKTGNLVSGQIRQPKDNERFFALLKVETSNNFVFYLINKNQNSYLFIKILIFELFDSIYKLICVKRIQKFCLFNSILTKRIINYYLIFKKYIYNQLSDI